MVPADIVLHLTKQADIAYDKIPGDAIVIDDGQSTPRGFAYRTPTEGLISFAGSKSIMDWLTDFNCLQKQYGKGLTHQGFLGEFEKFRIQLQKIYYGVPVDYTVMVTGHSLGGALSMYAAREMRLMFGARVLHVSQGCPHVFDKAGAADFDLLVPDSVRIQHHDDLVPRVPKINYRHAGELLRIDDSGKEIRFSGILGTIERWFEVAEADLRGSAETDHLMKNYLPAVQAWYDRETGKK